MKRSQPSAATFVLTACLVLGVTVPVASAQDAGAGNPHVTNDQSAVRKKFIAGFKRTMLNSAPGDAAMLRILVESSGAKRGVEVGTATGYGAILMGLGFERNKGELISVDIDPKMVAAARENLQKIGLDDVVTVVEGDALKVLPALDGQFDFVYLDAVKSDYLKYFQALEPKLSPGAMIVADNVIRSGKAMPDFFEVVRKSPDYLSTTIRSDESKQDGMMVIYKLK